MTPPTGGALARLREHNRQLESLVETVCEVNAGLTEHEVVERLLTRTLQHLDSEGGSILLERPDGGLRIAHAEGIPPEAANRTWIPVGKGIAGRVAATGQPLCCRDIERDRRIRRHPVTLRPAAHDLPHRESDHEDR